MHRSPRPGGAAAVRIIVLHVNVGPEIHAGAQAFIDEVLSQEDGGYHAVGDDVSTAVAAGPDILVYGASGANDDGYHYCLLGNLQTAQQWADAYSSGQLHQAARFIAQKCHELNVPPRLLTDAQVADETSRGICDHWAVNRAIVIPAYQKDHNSPLGPGDHTDVGANFPWGTFSALVVAAYGGAPVQPGSEDSMRLLVPAPIQSVPDQWRGAVIDYVVGKPCTMIALGGAIIDPPLDPVEGKSPCQGATTDGLPPGTFVIVANTPDARNNAPYRHTVR